MGSSREIFYLHFLALTCQLEMLESQSMALNMRIFAKFFFSRKNQENVQSVKETAIIMLILKPITRSFETKLRVKQ